MSSRYHPIQRQEGSREIGTRLHDLVPHPFGNHSHHHRVTTQTDRETLIAANRFIIQSRYEDDWLAARRQGVTATAVAHAATPGGFRDEVESWGQPAWGGNEFTEFGNWAERYVLETAHREYGILPNDWLIAGLNPLHLGTPDGLNPEHTEIAEAKTGGTIPVSVPRIHRDQCQWNMHVTGTVRCLYLFQLRVRTPANTFRLGLWEPLMFWVDRDDKRIGELEEVAEALMEARHARLPY